MMYIRSTTHLQGRKLLLFPFQQHLGVPNVLHPIHAASVSVSCRHTRARSHSRSRRGACSLLLLLPPPPQRRVECVEGRPPPRWCRRRRRIEPPQHVPVQVVRDEMSLLVDEGQRPAQVGAQRCRGGAAVVVMFGRSLLLLPARRRLRFVRAGMGRYHRCC